MTAQYIRIDNLDILTPGDNFYLSFCEILIWDELGYPVDHSSDVS